MNKIKEWFSSMEKTKRYLLLFLVVSFLCIIAASFFVKEEKVGYLNVQMLSIHDRLEIDEGVKENENISNNQENKQDEENTPAQSENKTEETGESPVSSGVSSNTNSTVGSEGTKEEIEVIEKIDISVIIRGLEGEVIASDKMQVEKDSSAFDVLASFCSSRNIGLNASGFSSNIYVIEIAGLKEKGNGPKSGWKYNVNGNYVSMSAGRYILQENDVMEWYYVVD